MHICPKCKDTKHSESRQCPLYDGTPICTKCCIKCRYHKEHFCRYSIENVRERKRTDELDQLDLKIYKTEEQIKVYQRRMKTHLVKELELELHILKNQRMWEIERIKKER